MGIRSESVSHRKAQRGDSHQIRIGMGRGNFRKDRRLSALVPIMNELRAAYVTGSAAKIGIGTALLKTLESKARELGLKKLQMHSSVTAPKFYEKNGYQNLGLGSHTMRSGCKMACFIMERVCPFNTSRIAIHYRSCRTSERLFLFSRCNPRLHAKSN